MLLPDDHDIHHDIHHDLNNHIDNAAADNDHEQPHDAAPDDINNSNTHDYGSSSHNHQSAD